MQIKINTPTSFDGKDKWEPYRRSQIICGKYQRTN